MGKISLILVIVLVFIAGWGIGHLQKKNPDPCPERFLFLNPNVNCGTKPVIDKSNPRILHESLSKLIESKKSSGEVDEVSVHFRDLIGGPSLGINEDELFIAASLLKLPTAITFYKLAEEKIPDLLNRQLRFESSQSATLEQYYKPAKTITPGTSYKVRELLSNSLIYSDNLSNEVLKASLNSIEPNINLVARTYQELGLVSPTSLNQADISTRGYASIFRQLYNASYVSPESSNSILSLLAESEFDQGIASGVPDNIKVANKFGERFLGDAKQLHDCGIVYFPDNPYLICVMTRGKNFETLAKVIGEISKMVYEEMESRRI